MAQHLVKMPPRHLPSEVFQAVGPQKDPGHAGLGMPLDHPRIAGERKVWAFLLRLLLATRSRISSEDGSMEEWFLNNPNLLPLILYYFYQLCLQRINWPLKLKYCSNRILDTSNTYLNGWLWPQVDSAYIVLYLWKKIPFIMTSTEFSGLDK